MSAPKFSDLDCGKIRNMFMMVEDMIELHRSACNAYSDPDSSEEQKRWGLYTGTAIQAVMTNHNLGHELKFADKKQ